MKFLVVFFSLVLSFSLSAQNSKKFPVSGNCGNCKVKIEKAANSLEGVTSAIWNLDNKEIEVEFDESVVSLDEIKQAIANVGYDTDTFKATKSHEESCSEEEAPTGESTEAMVKGPLSTIFSVSGNCGGCKKRIETAALSAKGVQTASWSSESQQLTITYSDSSIKINKVKKAIAAVGHDTDGYKATRKAYESLSGCCQYERVL